MKTTRLYVSVAVAEAGCQHTSCLDVRACGASTSHPFTVNVRVTVAVAFSSAKTVFSSDIGIYARPSAMFMLPSR
jgi:hypothetical protein